MTSLDEHLTPIQNARVKPTAWFQIAAMMLFGVLLGSNFFTLVHLADPSFQTSASRGLFLENNVLWTFIETLLNPTSAIFGVVLMLLAVPLLRTRLNLVARLVLTFLLVFGSMSAVQSGLQLKYDYHQTFGATFDKDERRQAL